MKSIYKIERIREDLSDQEWKNYLQFRQNFAKHHNYTVRFNHWELLKERSLERIKQGWGLYYAWKDGIEAGHYYFQHHFQNNPQKHFVHFNPQKHIELNEDFLKAMFLSLLDFEPNVPKLGFDSVNEKNKWIADQFEATLGSHIELFELNIADAKEEVIDQWLEESKTKFPNYKLKFFIDIPDPLLEEYSAVFLELLLDMPPMSSIKEFDINADEITSRQAYARKKNHCSYRYLVFNEDNKLIAKTNVWMDRNKPQVLNQYMTGALKDYRRQGLGKWMKAAMYKRLKMDFPEMEKICTETAIDNIGSRELSRQMGYKKTGFEKDYFIDREKILNFIKT